ncbi:MAG TPA: F0F1 ATP synthase subunit B [Paludibacteraceae bacterium]|jgi:F-type H+-transporting ATPase subunit b|nr:F0F1 ATP synthase subunit B [Paludibacteraceae bacterium]HOV84119.1 F0F1 ATP synthase subunit B [Paludibacteraceae bacterium]HPC26011.1 F0F1 ATP synthase subunit B [Paludibacteraceae bacterium]HRR62359.1 F0F1 ATP synthase subunit B [Paludibacteraceae bacterium]HRU63323.1 F0F1 ATP synthase subunit B [Paludibacteraceae bacterium]
MSLLTPDGGLVFWMLLSFGIVVLILAKFGFPVILQMIEKRKSYIEESLLEAEKARNELENVKLEGKKIINEAHQAHEKIMKEAAQLKESLLNDAREKASQEAEKILQEARENIQKEKEAALEDIRRQVADMSIVISEKLLRTKLRNKEEQMQIIDRLIDEMKINKS